jgi:hypothetical protein
MKMYRILPEIDPKQAFLYRNLMEKPHFSHEIHEFFGFFHAGFFNINLYRPEKG